MTATRKSIRTEKHADASYVDGRVCPIQESETTEAEARPAFRITDDRSAEWLLQKLATLESEKARVQAQAERIVKQLDSDAASLRHLYLSELEAYCRAKMAAGGNRRRSVHFLQGSASVRTVRGGLRITDPQTAQIYAKKALPDAIRSVETLDAGKYREAAQKRFQETGERLPGVDIAPDRETFLLSFGKREE